MFNAQDNKNSLKISKRSFFNLLTSLGKVPVSLLLSVDAIETFNIEIQMPQNYIFSMIKYLRRLSSNSPRRLQNSVGIFPDNSLFSARSNMIK